MGKKTGLGQGMGVLFGEQREKYFNCEVNRLVTNKHQPRTHFDPKNLQELANSIKEKGVIQPLIITAGEGRKFNLIAGERRLRASKLAGLARVPVILLDINNEDSLLELALIENIQRTDLNPIDEAEAYQKLIEKFGYTQEETAKRVGKQRSTISNMLRLLKLPKVVQKDIANGLISEGHGRTLIKLINNSLKLNEIKNLVIKNRLSVRQTEKLVKQVFVIEKPNNNQELKRNTKELPPAYINTFVTRLTNRLNSKISINQNGSRGKIEIDYYSLDDLERVVEMLLDE